MEPTTSPQRLDVPTEFSLENVAYTQYSYDDTNGEPDYRLFSRTPQGLEKDHPHKHAFWLGTLNPRAVYVPELQEVLDDEARWIPWNETPEFRTLTPEELRVFRERETKRHPAANLENLLADDNRHEPTNIPVYGTMWMH